jgi:N-methylhydantoinase B
MRPGDLYWYNDCYGSAGAVSHSNDQVFIAPVFAEGRLSAFAQSWAHFNDIGGLRPGSISPDATEIFQEGIIVPPVRLARDGALNEELLRIFVRNSRFPKMVTGDVRAAVAAVRLGERRLVELFERFGRARTLAAFDAAIAETRAVVAQRFAETFKPGTYRFSESIARDGQGNGPFALRFEMSASSNGITIDTSESDDQAHGPINFIMSPDVPRMAFGIYFLSHDPAVLLNDGARHAVQDVRTRPGSILEPRFPAPLGQRGITLIRVMTSCLGLINVATEGRGVGRATCTSSTICVAASREAARRSCSPTALPSATAPAASRTASTRSISSPTRTIRPSSSTSPIPCACCATRSTPIPAGRAATAAVAA